jgi:hypothetical protein
MLLLVGSAVPHVPMQLQPASIVLLVHATETYDTSHVPAAEAGRNA